MPRICKITGKRTVSGHSVSKSHRKTKKCLKPNLQRKRIFDPESGQYYRLRLSAAAIRTLSRIGLKAYLRKKELELRDLV